MKTSTGNRILTTHVGSIPRPERTRALLRSRLAGQEAVDFVIRVNTVDSCEWHRRLPFRPVD
jgi:hypothetical protein